jgi:DNA ligase-1
MDKFLKENTGNIKPPLVSNKNEAKLEEDVEVQWEAGSPVPYIALCNTFESISSVGGRLDKEELFCRLFRNVIKTTPQDLIAMVYLASNSISPAYEGLELGIGDSLLVKAICEATGRKKEQVEQAYKNEGDLGTVALTSRANQKTISFAAKPKPMTATYVLDQLRLITNTKGEKAQGRKVDIIKAMMIRCQGTEAKYLIRSLQGKLRIGTAEQTVLVSLSKAFAMCPTVITEIDGVLPSDQAEPPEALKLRTGSKLSIESRNELAIVAVKRAFSECPNLSILINALLTRPLHLLYQSCHLVAGVPVAPMLAKPTKGINEVLKRLSGLEFIMEYKYDGERAQVHLLSDGTIKIFSRNSEDNSGKYPDVVEVIRRSKKETVTSFVLDAEVVVSPDLYVSP